jgi:hypothetical protein
MQNLKTLALRAPVIILGVKFADGIEVVRPQAQPAAT